MNKLEPRSLWKTALITLLVAVLSFSVVSAAPESPAPAETNQGGFFSPWNPFNMLDDDNDPKPPSKIRPKTYEPTKTISDATPIFIWEYVPGNTGALLQVKDGSKLVVNLELTSDQYACNTSRCSYQLTQLLPNRSLKWYITVRVGGESTKTSKSMKFKVDAQEPEETPQPTQTTAPGVPTATPSPTTDPGSGGGLPTNVLNTRPRLEKPDGTINDTTPVFEWREMSNDTGVVLVVKDGSTQIVYKILSSADYTCSGDRCTYQITEPLPFKVLTWNLQIIVGNSITRVSKDERFTISSVPSPDKPDGTIRDTDLPTYSWSQIEGAEAYGLMVQRGNTVVVNETVNAADLTCFSGECYYTPSVNLTNSKYYWQVRTYASGVWSAYSKREKFSVKYDGPPTTPTPPPVTATPTPEPTPVQAHLDMTEFNGAETCAQCHMTEAQGVLNSEHIQWSGKWDDVNTYCTAPEPAEWGCLSCHAGTGNVVNPTIADVDCLICHNNDYKRALYSTGEQITLTSWNGDSHTYTLPAKVDGSYQFVPKYSAMPDGTTLLSLAQNVTRPNSQTCLNCHAKAGGSDGAKRGDIYMGLASDTLSTHDDFHMSPDGANLECTDCHVTGHDHKIPGQGIDLRVNEGTVTCEQCHNSTPHSNSQLNTHAQKVACQTCHIPTFGKNTSTEMSRDWTNPVWSPSGLGGQGAWLGEEVRGSNVVPNYVWWNGTSFQYTLGDTINPELDGTYALSKAFGSINDGKIYPVKIHTAVQPRENSTGSLVAYDVLWNFMTGAYEEAAQNGVDFMGLPGGYTWVDTSVQQLITHGVEPKSSALGCNDCHGSTARINLPAMGYTLKGPQSTVCTQCHSLESNPGFTKVHDEHVNDKRVDCSLCHGFTRPERNLNTNLQFDD